MLNYFINKNRKSTPGDKRCNSPLFSENWFGYLENIMCTTLKKKNNVSSSEGKQVNVPMCSVKVCMITFWRKIKCNESV